MSRKLNAYKGTLTAEQISEGMNAAAENSARLVKDAEALMENGSNATALSLAALAIEESGKISILRALAVARSDDEARSCWRDYRSHTSKNASWIFPELFANGARQLEQFRSMFSKESDHTATLDNLKQLGFYTDCLGQAHWTRPIDAIDQALAEKIISVAKLMAHPARHTAREIELWIQHIGPVWKKDMALMKQALVNWQEGMYREGLSATPSHEMRNFVYDGPRPGV